MKTFNHKLWRLLLPLLLLGLSQVRGQFENYLDSLRAQELYEYVEGSGSIQYLAKGNSEQAMLQLEQPISFYSEKYEQIYVSITRLYSKYTYICMYIIC